MERISFSARKFLRDLEKYSKLITESYIYDDDGYENHDECEFMEPGEENMNLSEQDDNISKIRDAAMCGLQKYGKDVDSEMYQFFKKIWLMCDKAVSEKDSVSGNKGNAE